METAKKPCLPITLLLLVIFLLVSTVHGAQPGDASRDKAAAAAAAGGGQTTTVRIGAAGAGHGHGYSSHSGGHPNGNGTPEQGGAGVVDPRNNLPARSHHRNGASSGKALGYSSLLSGLLVGVILTVLER